MSGVPTNRGASELFRRAMDESEKPPIEVYTDCVKSQGLSCSCYACLRQRLADIAEIVETADRRLTAIDGPCDDQQPIMQLHEWMKLYQLTKLGDPED